MRDISKILQIRQLIDFPRQHVIFKSEPPPNPDTPEAMKLLTTLIAFVLTSTMATAQLANEFSFDERGPSVIATSHLLSGSAFIASLPNTSGYKPHGFAQVKGADGVETMVFVCKVTPKEVVLLPLALNAEFPLKFAKNETVTVRPIMNYQRLERFVRDYSGLCEKCKPSSTSAL